MNSVWAILPVFFILLSDRVKGHKDFPRGQSTVDISRVRLVKDTSGRIGIDQSCGANNFLCAINEKCCGSNGLFSTCCPFIDGICCGTTECCRGGQICCAGRCCPEPNGICCYTYCCPAGHRCSGGPNGYCIPFGRGDARLTGNGGHINALHLTLIGLLGVHAVWFTSAT